MILDGGKGMTLSQQVGIIMRQGGRFFNSIYISLVNYLQREGLFSVCIDLNLEELEGIRPHESVNRLLCSPLKGIIVDGNSYWKYPFLDGDSGHRAVFVNCYDAPGEVPGRGVFIDYEEGARMAASHLRELGHRNVLFLAIMPKEYPGQEETHHRNHPLYKSELGFRRGMAECSGSARSEIAYYEYAGAKVSGDDLVRGILSRRDRPTAVVCAADRIAVSVIDAAQKMGLRVPEDLAVVGMYNTPWCDESPVPLTSVSFEENEIARQAVEVLLAGDPRPKIRFVKPRLVVRASCGAGA